MDQEDAPQTVVRIKADPDAVPLWEPERAEPVSWEDLELPERLAAELREWSERYDARLPNPYRWQVRGGLPACNCGRRTSPPSARCTTTRGWSGSRCSPASCRAPSSGSRSGAPRSATSRWR